MKTAKLRCGCRYECGDHERWIELCPGHKREADETHARWAAEHRESRRRFDAPLVRQAPAPSAPRARQRVTPLAR